MTQKDKLWWKETRSRGRGWFVLRVGILRHGVRAGICLMIVIAIYAFFIFLFGGPTPNIIQSIIGSVLICALTTFFVGSFVGIAVWNQHEKDYSNITGDDHVA